MAYDAMRCDSMSRLACAQRHLELGISSSRAMGVGEMSLFPPPLLSSPHRPPTPSAQCFHSSGESDKPNENAPWAACPCNGGRLVCHGRECVTLKCETKDVGMCSHLCCCIVCFTPRAESIRRGCCLLAGSRRPPPPQVPSLHH